MPSRVKRVKFPKAKKEHKKIRLTLTQKQYSALVKGKTAHIKHSQLLARKHYIYVNPVKHRKLLKAKRNKTGSLIKLSKQELKLSGHGLRELIKKAKDIYKSHGKKHVGPLVKRAVHSGLSHVKNVAKASPAGFFFDQELESLGNRYIPQLTNYIGHRTGLYDTDYVEPIMMAQEGSGMVYRDNLNQKHQAYNPIMPYLPSYGGMMIYIPHHRPSRISHSKKLKKHHKKGGSFRTH